MLYIDNPSRNPYFNLALEEYALRFLPPEHEYFMLWQNDPAIIVGSGQNTPEEIDLDFVRRNGIHVVRRRSGGGTVYHDQGNLNFSFIVNRSGSAFNFEKFTGPVLRTLHKLGLGSAASVRNDLLLDNRKFSGNAQYVTGDRLLHHGTLLLNSELDNLVRALSVARDKIQSKGIKSVRSRVVNISEALGEPIPVSLFKAALLQTLGREGREIKHYRLGARDLQGIRELMRVRYLRWEWNFKSFAEFNVRRSHRFSGGKVEARLGVAGGRIRRCKFYGDFFGYGDLSEFEKQLIGRRRDKGEIRDALELVDTGHYFHQIEKEGLLDLLA